MPQAAEAELRRGAPPEDAAASAPQATDGVAADANPASPAAKTAVPPTGFSSTFVAVPGRHRLAEATANAERPLPRSDNDAALLRDQALREALRGAPLLLVASALATITAGALLTGSLPGTAWTLLALVLHGVWARTLWLAHRRPRRHAQGERAWRRCVTLVSIGMALWAVLPWLVNDDALPPGFALPMLYVLSLAGASVLASLPAAAMALVLMPLSWAAWALLRGAIAGDAGFGSGASGASTSGVAAALAASGFAAALAVTRHRAWQRGARLAAAAESNIRLLEGERDNAQRADEEKSRFLAIASHDLRQPVHALGLFAATLEKRLLGSPEEALARNMIRSIDGLDRSFNAMLDISRLDAGTIEPNIQHFPLRDLFRRLHMHFAGQAELSGLGLRFSPGGKSVSSDPQLLERILGNLVQNAIKYTEAGGVVVVARSTATHINVEVWDTGVGIRATDLPRIFDEFWQVGRSERARAQGLGIGLAIVKRLAALVGHELTVVSRPGRGTMFRIGIPIGGLQGIDEATAAADTLPMPLADPHTVLVIDDEEAIREGLCLLLEEWGYHAISAATVAQAHRLSVGLSAPPDLILSDLHLGDGPDGIEAIEAVRAACGHDVKAILITGDTSHEEMRRATDSGHPVLFKPVQPRRLYNVLRGLLS